MGTYTIYDTQTKELTVDIDELKNIFQEEWGWTLEAGRTEEDFIRELVYEYGIDEIEESLENGPFSLVDIELSIVKD